MLLPVLDDDKRCGWSARRIGRSCLASKCRD
jgi:hypothetical protein